MLWINHYFDRCGRVLNMRMAKRSSFIPNQLQQQKTRTIKVKECMKCIHPVTMCLRLYMERWRYERHWGSLEEKVYFWRWLEKRSPLVAISRLNKFMLGLPTINKVWLVLDWAVQEVCARLFWLRPPPSAIGQHLTSFKDFTLWFCVSWRASNTTGERC